MSTDPMTGVQPEPAPTAAPAEKTRRPMPQALKRLLLIVVGVVVLGGSIVGFYMTSDAFDERVPVLVAVRDIGVGETVGAADFGSDRALVGSIPHVPWTPSTPLLFNGKVAVRSIAAGSLVVYDMFIDAETAPVGVELEVVVPLDLSLVTDQVFEGDVVLLVDPGAEPVEGDDGRPRQVVRQFVLTNFESSQMRLFLPPEEWAEWEALLTSVGGTLLVVDLGLGADPTETTERLNAVWADQWLAAVTEIALAAEAAAAVPAAESGELEVIVSLDASLVPSGVVEGDLVLLIDPGAEPLGNDPGRPATVIRTLELQNYADGQMQMFVGPEEWLYWRSLPDQLGATPMVLPVPEGSDVEDMSTRLNGAWHDAWQQSVAEAGAQP